MGIRMAGSTARLSLQRIAGVNRNLYARVPVRPMKGPAPSIELASARKGFSSLSDPDEYSHRSSQSAQALPSLKAGPAGEA